MKPEIPAEVDEHRDRHWRREGMGQVETAFEAERFIEHVGFTACLTDCRKPGPSLYVAVCGRRDAVMPRNVQKDEEASRTWLLKDEIVARGHVYYAQDVARQGDVPGAADDSVFSGDLGRAPLATKRGG